MPFQLHFRKDSPAGITPPNLDSDVDMIGHMTKHRGMRTPFTSVSERAESVRHFSGELYSVQPDSVIADGHGFHPHGGVIEQLRAAVHASQRAERTLAQRAFQYAERSREALIEWHFAIDRVERKDRITWCGNQIQKYFTRVRT